MEESNVDDYLEGKLLPPNTFKAPGFLDRVKHAALICWPMGLMAILMSVFALVFADVVVKVIAVLCALLFIASFIYFAYLKFQPYYTIEGLTVKFMDLDYYVPPKVMKQFKDEIDDQWRNRKVKEGVVLTWPESLLEGVTLNLTSKPPTYDGKDVVGLTYPDRKTSYVHAPHVMSHSGAGYELRLHMCHRLFPNRSEAEDVDWMVEHNLI